jgi:hypothetical protein
MTSYQNFMDRFFTDLAIHSPGQTLHHRHVELSMRYQVPDVDVRELLPQWAHLGYIRLEAWDGERLRDWSEWPDIISFFFNSTDAGHVRITLLAAGREHAELVKKKGIGFIADI